MPSHLKTLPIVLVLAGLVFLIAKVAACESATSPADFQRRRNLWFAITLFAFLAHNFWLFIVLTGALVFVAQKRENNPLAMYLALLFAVPMIQSQVSGLGIFQHAFTIHYGRLLALVLLLPAFLRLQSQPGAEPIGRSVYDKLVIGYVILQFALMLTANTFTNALRQGVFYGFIDVFLPYYVASRGIKDLRALRDAVMAFLVAAAILAATAVVEVGLHWLLYATVDDALGINWSYGRYLERGEGLLRAQATTGQPIPLGYLLAVALGLGLYARTFITRPLLWPMLMALLAAGLIGSFSRGPWVGAAIIILLYIVLSPRAVRHVLAFALLGLVLVPVVAMTPAWDLIVKYLPFVGSVETGNIDFRRRLLEIAVVAILQNPFFGAFDYIYSPAFQELRTGSGLVDIVNTYVGIGLASGLVGLGLFLGFFVTAMTAAYRAMKSSGADSEAHAAAQALLATLTGALLIIGTTSSITVVPLIYYTLGGLCVAYARMSRAGVVVATDAERLDAWKGGTAYSRPGPARSLAR